jgi:predicted aspartyl protease
MKFSYSKIPHSHPSKKWISRPMITVTLHGPRGSVNVHALLDSGADKCLFSNQIGEEIGLNVKEGEEEIFGGIEGGRVKSYLHEIEVQIFGDSKKIKVVAGFTDARGVNAILGQEGFFDAFRIKFEKDRDAIEINPLRKL